SNYSGFSNVVSVFVPNINPSIPLNFSIWPTVSYFGFHATWDTAPYATSYRIQVSMSDAFVPITTHSISTSNVNNYTHPYSPNLNHPFSLQSENSYFFRIQSCITS